MMHSLPAIRKVQTSSLIKNMFSGIHFVLLCHLYICTSNCNREISSSHALTNSETIRIIPIGRVDLPSGEMTCLPVCTHNFSQQWTKVNLDR